MFLSDKTMRLLMEMECPADQKVALLTAMREDEEAATLKQHKRELNRDRQQRHRAARPPSDEALSSVTERDQAQQASPAPLSRPLSPQTPLTPTHSPPECVSTRARGDGDFERFWKAYPRKTAKDVARKAFPGALRRASLATMIAALERQREWEQWRRGIVPHPATWLNQSRWNDEDPEIPEPRKAHGPHTDQRQAAREDSLRAHHAGAMAALNRRLGPVG